ncbi:HAD family hydrolase [Natronospora cellulosivora (SeqCode)]
MFKVKCILFDCMETLIDIKDYPDLSMYASWAYYGSGCEDKWDSFEMFLDEYKKARDYLDNIHKNHKEYNIYNRFRLMIDNVFKDEKEEFRKKLFKMITYNYWKNYKSNCFVRPEVKELLKKLHKKFSLAVVSNFMKEDGVEELLEENGIIKYFDFILTSIKTGWRKPNEIIYNEAIKKAGVSFDEIIFVGDNYHCDYQGPRLIGLNSILLDRKNKHLYLENRIKNLIDLERYIY